MDANFFLINAKLAGLWKGIFSERQKVLDIGCGEDPGYHRYIPSTVVCTDKVQTEIVHLLSDAQVLPFKPASFDGVVNVNALYYCEDPKKALEEFSRVLKNGGKLVMVTPFLYPIHDVPHDKYRFTEYGLRELLKEGFSVQKIVPVGGLFSMPALVIHSLHKGVLAVVPHGARSVMNGVLFVVLLIPSLLGQMISLLNVLDRTRRWPVYYFTVARKK